MDDSQELEQSFENDSYDAVKAVEIDDEGTSKFIVVELVNCMGSTKSILRGSKQFEYHTQIFDYVTDEVDKIYGEGTRYKVLGGGKICHDPKAKTINIYGYSQAFGAEDRKQTINMLRKVYPDYVAIKSSKGPKCTRNDA